MTSTDTHTTAHDGPSKTSASGATTNAEATPGLGEAIPGDAGAVRPGDLSRVLGQERPPRPSGLSASLTFGWRSLLKIKHVPEQLLDVTLFPIMMTLMFVFLFGGAIGGSVGEYLPFFLPGILSVSIVMITMYTALAVNTDITKGVFDRFRTLPIWRPAPMVGYLLGDAFRYVIASAIIIGVGLLIGVLPGGEGADGSPYTPAGGVLGVLAAVGVLVVFCFALSWVWTMFGLLMRSEKSVMGVAMMVIMPLSFLSSAYVPVDTLPGWLQAFVNVNPVTLLVDTVRALMNGVNPGMDIVWLGVMSAAILAVFGSITMRIYNRK